MSQDELVDIVDEKGNFIKVEVKREAHRLGLLHKCVTLQIIDSNGRWLLARAANGRQDSGQWILPVGGHVSAGESEIDAIRREAEEEAGLTGDLKFDRVGSEVLNREIIGRKENHLITLFSVRSDIEPKIDHEHASHKYFSDEEIRQKIKEEPEIFGEAFHFHIKNFFPNLLS